MDGAVRACSIRETFDFVPAAQLRQRPAGQPGVLPDLAEPGSRATAGLARRWRMRGAWASVKPLTERLVRPAGTPRAG